MRLFSWYSLTAIVPITTIIGARHSKISSGPKIMRSTTYIDDNPSTNLSICPFFIVSVTHTKNSFGRSE